MLSGATKSQGDEGHVEVISISIAGHLPVQHIILLMSD